LQQGHGFGEKLLQTGPRDFEVRKVVTGDQKELQTAAGHFHQGNLGWRLVLDFATIFSIIYKEWVQRTRTFSVIDKIFTGFFRVELTAFKRSSRDGNFMESRKLATSSC